jgi:hypothetical protein
LDYNFHYCYHCVFDKSQFKIKTIATTLTKKLPPTSGLLQGWLDIGAMGIFIAVVLHLGWTYIVGLLFVNLYFYIFNQQRFRADTATIPALQASPARCVQ